MGVRNDYFGRQGAVGQPVVHETLLGCRFTGFNARCDWEYDNCCMGFDESLIYLGDRDDRLLLRYVEHQQRVPRVYAEEGNDTVSSRRGGFIDCGPGTDTVYTLNPANVAAQLRERHRRVAG